MSGGVGIANGDVNRCGTVSRYANGKCRCGECRAAWSAYHAAYRITLRGRQPAAHDLSAYTNYGCRCETCRAAKRASRTAAA